MTCLNRRGTLGLGLGAMLYGAIGPGANAVWAAGADNAGLAGLKDYRTGAMSRLVVLDAPRKRIEAPFRDLYGNQMTLADYAGKVVLLNIWATWCPPCRAEMPSIDRLAGDMQGPDFAVVALSADHGDAERVAEFLKLARLYNLKVAQDRSGAVSRQAGILGLPATLILDREGREIARMIGDAVWDSAEARALIGRVIEMTRAQQPIRA